jgi:hypothetical protein
MTFLYKPIISNCQPVFGLSCIWISLFFSGTKFSERNRTWNLFMSIYYEEWTITVAAQSMAWTVFACLNTGIVDSNPTRGINVCVCLFRVCAVLCVGSGLATGWSLIQRVLRTVYRIKKLKKRPRFKGLYSHRERKNMKNEISERNLYARHISSTQFCLPQHYSLICAKLFCTARVSWRTMKTSDEWIHCTTSRTKR